MDTAKQIAEYMLSKKPLTPKQVQKLLYYAYALYLIKYNDCYQKGNMNKLFDDKIERWDNGPVIRNVYNYIKHVAMSNELVTCKAEIKLSSPKIENFIDKILKVYGQYSGYQLENLTHSETPWIVTGRNEVIDDKIIFDYYSEKYKNLSNI